jgi:hypothetical protein
VKGKYSQKPASNQQELAAVSFRPIRVIFEAGDSQTHVADDSEEKKNIAGIELRISSIYSEIAQS